jgi:hypothetical protein
MNVGYGLVQMDVNEEDLDMLEAFLQGYHARRMMYLSVDSWTEA